MSVRSPSCSPALCWTTQLYLVGLPSSMTGGCQFGNRVSGVVIRLSFFIAHERWHRGVALGADVFALKDSKDRHGKNFEVEPKTAMVHVPYIQLKLLLPGNGIAPVHLSPARDAGLDVMPSRLFRAVAGQVFDQEGPRADKAHFAAQHIPKFRQFIQAAAPQ